MKASYTTTPRTLNDCTFHTWGDPYDSYSRKDYSRAWWLCICAVAVAGALAIIWMKAP